MTETQIDQALRTAYAHHQARRHEQAEALYRQVLAEHPDHPDGLQLLGLLAGQTGRYAEAIELLSRVVAVHPKIPRLLSWLGEYQLLAGQREAALATLQRALALEPNSVNNLVNVGAILTDTGRLEEAVAALRRAITLAPDLVEAHINLGSALKGLARIDEAIQVLELAVQLNPQVSEAHNNLGTALLLNGDLDRAHEAFTRALALSPDYAEAHNNLGIVCKDLGRLEEARRSQDRAVALAPDKISFHNNRLYTLHLDPALAPADVMREHRSFDAVARRLAPPHTPLQRAAHDKLRIAYVSPDFRSHAVAFFLLPLLEHHDRKRFHITCYSTGAVRDEVTEKFRGLADRFESLVELSDEQAADLIRRQEIDILIDLAGHTANSRLLVFARKPAPLQLSWLGYPGSSGLSAIDARVSDPYADPPSSSDLHDKVLRLPTCAWCFHPLSGSPPVNPLPALHHEKITLGTFNTFAKISQPLLESWAEILQRLPNARLVLKNQSARSPVAQQKLRDFFAAKNIVPERLEFLPWQTSFTDHLLAYNRIDLALDTFPYHGTTTTCEALWMGVPVITLAGHAHASRVGVSLLKNAAPDHDLDDLITPTPADYIARTIDLARNLPHLSHLRTTLRESMRQSPLMNAQRFAADFENAMASAFREKVPQ